MRLAKIDQSIDVTLDTFVDNFRIFLRNEEAWEEVNQQILASREHMAQNMFPAIEELKAAVAHEVGFQEKLWQGDYGAALGFAERVLSELRASELRGYRAIGLYGTIWREVRHG